MVNALVLGNLQEGIQRDLGSVLAGPPAVYHGGVAVDHDRGLGHRIAMQLLSKPERYEPTEFVYGFIPTRVEPLSFLFFQFPVLDIKGKYVPGAIHLAAVVRAPIPGTIVALQLGFKARYLPLSAIWTPDFRPKDIYAVVRKAHDVLKHKTGWYPLLESLNGDNATLKAAYPKQVVTTIYTWRGNFDISVDQDSPIGLIQLAPYKGLTILTMQRVPSRRAGPDKPLYELSEAFDNLSRIAAHVLHYPQRGEEIGDLVITRSNSQMIELVLKQIEAMTPPT